MVRIPKIFHEFIDQIQIEFKFKNPEKLKNLSEKIKLIPLFNYFSRLSSLYFFSSS